MTLRISITRGASTLYLGDNVDYKWMAYDGFGMVPIHHITERGPLQNGETRSGYRIDPRLVKLSFINLASSHDDQFDNRRTLIGYFAPSSSPLVLTFEQPSGSTYYLDCYYNGGLQFASDDKASARHAQRCLVELYCPDGLWRSATCSVTQSLSASSATFNVTYNGTGDEYPVIRMYGNHTGYRIVNNATSEYLQSTSGLSQEFGGVIVYPDYIDFDTRYGNKTVLNSSACNQIQTLTSDSDLATFHITPSDGFNSFTISASSVSSSTSAIITYFQRYAGI